MNKYDYRYMTVPTVASELNISEEAAQLLGERKILPFFHSEAGLRVARTDFEDYVSRLAKETVIRFRE